MNAQKRIFQSLPTFISAIFLPPLCLNDLPKNTQIEIRITTCLTRSFKVLGESLKVLTESTRVVALVVDLLGSEIMSVGKEFGFPSYIYFPSTAMLLSMVLYLQKLDQKHLCEYKDLPQPVIFPGYTVPLHGIDFPDPLHYRKSPAYKDILNWSRRYLVAAGIMINSFLELETKTFKALMEEEPDVPPIYPVGPIVRTGSSNEVDGSGCLKWLGEQPSESVLFVSFGSGGTLTQKQLTELAFGLEMSEQRFIWVVRSPNEKTKNGNFFIQEDEDRVDFHFLPDGFAERTKGSGLVVSSWAPQAEILSHGSTGGFLTHCGWNSTLESIVNGVPLIAWPLYAEQRMNAVLLADDLKVAFRVREKEEGIVVREDISRYAREIMEGEEGKMVRKKMRDLKDSALKALSQDGSSTKSLAKVVETWKKLEQ
ncbi:LOW QUALITY PROTEIN: hydroquinone glucosyltransferase-like [Carica papaya]|uniref:LOW QUALITY PROTEIN: hydroquinone glucosyltransferase-like n=1 Tax=Carica papaya TaxID=3649 RepID=UPI000B8CADC7|nr:LOW QUALITY PROTEIN: hydroquinone glucosyltransferase-like [Carica papaya]